MSHFENLWQQYVRTELGARTPAPEELASLRNAFFTGAWCQMMFNRKMVGLDSERALTVLRDVEDELIREAITHNPDPTNQSRPRGSMAA